MKYVELYIKSLKSQQAQSTPAAPVSPKVYNLPGLKSFQQMREEEIIKFKSEYNIVLQSYQKIVKQHKSARGDKKKDLKPVLASKKEHLESLLQKVGKSTPSERVNGFEVPNAK